MPPAPTGYVYLAADGVAIDNGPLIYELELAPVILPVAAITTRSLSVVVIKPLVKVRVPFINKVPADFHVIAFDAVVRLRVKFFIVVVTKEPGNSVPFAPQFKTIVPLFVRVVAVELVPAAL